MKLKELINEVIEEIQHERGLQFTGKTIKGITYYVFIDADYIVHYISAQTILEMCKRCREKGE